MQQWKNEEQQSLDLKEHAPNPIAQGSVKPRELKFEFDDLSTWSNERVFSLTKKLRAQEQILDRNTVKFYHDENGQPGKEMENERLADIVEVLNEVDLPELVIHVRSFITVSIEPLSNPNCILPDYSLIGTESIGELKEMCVTSLRRQMDFDGKPILSDTIKLEDCKLYVNRDSPVDDEMSLYAVCDNLYEGRFDPMVHRIFFALTVDKQETYILSAQFDNTIMSLIAINTLFMSSEHYGSSETFNYVLKVAEWIFNAGYTLEFLVKVVAMKGFGNYIRIQTNQFDLLIVASAWVNFFFEATGLNLTFVRVFRLLRALRVTRLLRKFESVRKIVDATFNSLQPVINIM